jgi:hypothetical protein
VRSTISIIRAGTAEYSARYPRNRPSPLDVLCGSWLFANASHLQYIYNPMKSSLLPPLRVERRLRAQAERLLREDETLSSFILRAVQEQVRTREIEDEFIKRGLASRDRARRSGKYISAAKVIDSLRCRLLAQRSKTPRYRKKRR